jgi:chromosome segregation ATPase
MSEIPTSATTRMPDTSTAARAEEVFLTPRVLDQSAYEAMTVDLKALIADADGSGQTLRKTTHDVRGLTGVLRTALTELQQRIERAGKVSPALEHWVSEAREISMKGLDAGRVARELERAVSGIVESRKAEFEHAVAPTVEALRQLKREMDRIKAGAEAALDEKALQTRIHTTLTAAAESFDRDLQARVDRVRGSLDAALIAYERRVAELEERAARAGSMIERHTAALEEQEERSREVESSWHTSDGRLIDAQRRLGGVDEGLRGVESRSARLAALPGVLDRAERNLRESRDAASRLEGLTREVERLRTLLASELLAGADAVDAIAERNAAKPSGKPRKADLRDAA